MTKLDPIVGPFAKGPVNVPVLIETEQDLLNTFGKPSNLDGQYEYWLSASSYLSYGGTLRVIRTDDNSLINAHAGVSSSLSLKIKSAEDYSNNYSNVPIGCMQQENQDLGQMESKFAQ